MIKKPIPDIPDHEVGDNGRIYRRGKMIWPGEAATGHLTFCAMHSRGYKTTVSVARAVGEAFCPDFHKSLRPVHKDGNRANCRPGNLRWVPVRDVTKVTPGDGRRTAKLTEDAVRDIRSSTEGVAALARKYGVSCSHVSDVRNGHAWKHIK